MSQLGEHWRDVKAHRKLVRDQQKEQDKYISEAKATNMPLCWDWMFVMGSCHYARDCASFKTYTPITETICRGSWLDPSRTDIAGVGSVELQVHRSASSTATTTITLYNVLHIPDAICNGIRAWKVCASEQLGETDSRAFDEDGQPLFYGIDFCGLNRLVIASDQHGAARLQEVYARGNVALMLSVHTSKEELDPIYAQCIQSWDD